MLIQKQYSDRWTLIIDRFLPESFGYDQYVQRYRMFESLGFEIVIAVVDYMNNMQKSQEARPDLQVRVLFSNMCNFNKANETLLVSAHQLNRTAMQLDVEKKLNLVKYLGPDPFG
jgi:hypothetical protein